MVDYAALYQQKLGRAPTASALAYWQGRGAEGLNSFNASAAQEVSARPASTAPTPTPATSPVASNANNDATIKSMYSQYLGRDAESGDVDYWNSQLAGGKTINQIRSDFVASSEYAGRAASSTKPFTYVDHDNNAATAPVLGNNPNSEIKFGYRPDGSYGMMNGFGVQKKAPTYSGGGGYNFSGGPRPASNVAQKIADVTARDSPMMTQARARGFQSANSRGLINSSLAGQAAEQAVLDVAVPIGSQQDAQDFQANENYRGYGYNTQLQSQQDAQQLKVQSIQNTYDGGQASQNRNFQERSAISTSTAAADVAYQNALNNINANPNLSAEAREAQLVAARNRFDSAYQLAEQIYNIDLSW